MVNFQNPVVVVEDVCACAFAEKYRARVADQWLTSFNRDSDENLAYCGWTLLVSLPHRALWVDSHNISNNDNPVLILL
jgi:hypothetical protein